MKELEYTWRSSHTSSTRPSFLRSLSDALFVRERDRVGCQGRCRSNTRDASTLCSSALDWEASISRIIIIITYRPRIRAASGSTSSKRLTNCGLFLRLFCTISLARYSSVIWPSVRDARNCVSHTDTTCSYCLRWYRIQCDRAGGTVSSEPVVSEDSAHTHTHTHTHARERASAYSGCFVARD